MHKDLDCYCSFKCKGFSIELTLDLMKPGRNWMNINFSALECLGSAFSVENYMVAAGLGNASIKGVT